MFTKEVEEYFLSRGFTKSATFVKIVREWHEACNSRGLSADQHIWRLHAMHDFLLNDVDLTEFPPTFSCYIKSMTIQTFEVILQNILTCIQLYSFTFRGHYNAHVISTLTNESFFLDLCHLDKESPIYPKA